MFAKLRSGPENAKSAEQGIWKIWMTADSPTAEVLLGQATKAINDNALPQAMAMLTRLVGAYPDFAEGWNKRATVFFMIGRDNESLSDIERALDLEPRHFGALSGRGMIYQRQKKYSAAEDAFRDALRVNPAMDPASSAIKELERLEQGGLVDQHNSVVAIEQIRQRHSARCGKIGAYVKRIGAARAA